MNDYDNNIDQNIREKLVDKFLDTSDSNIKTNSRINKKQVLNLTKLFLFSDTFNNNFSRDLANNILQLQVSLAGYGRRELVEILKTTDNLFTEENEEKNVKNVFR